MKKISTLLLIPLIIVTFLQISCGLPTEVVLDQDNLTVSQENDNFIITVDFIDVNEYLIHDKAISVELSFYYYLSDVDDIDLEKVDYNPLIKEDDNDKITISINNVYEEFEFSIQENDEVKISIIDLNKNDSFISKEIPTINKEYIHFSAQLFAEDTISKEYDSITEFFFHQIE